MLLFLSQLHKNRKAYHHMLTLVTIVVSVLWIVVYEWNTQLNERVFHDPAEQELLYSCSTWVITCLVAGQLFECVFFG